MTLGAFFALLTEDPRPACHPDVWVRRIGEDALEALRQERILVDLPPATSYSCGGWEGSGCPREILHEPCDGVPDWPLVAVCGSDVPSCPSVRLRPSDLERVGLSFPEWLRTLGALFGVRAPISPAEDPVLPGVHVLGAGPDGRLLAYAKRPRGRSAQLYLRRARGQISLLVPQRGALPASVLMDHPVGDPVEVRGLSDELVVANGRLRRRRVAPRDVADRLVVDQDGERPLDEAGYRALLADSAGLALFLDLTQPVGAGHVPVLTRDAENRPRRIELPNVKARTLLELARQPGPVSPRNLATLREAQILDKPKYIERLRREFDTKLGRRRWRFLNAQSGDCPEAKTYAFAPPPGVRYAMVASCGG